MTARTDDMVSGSRLHATAFVGVDGARSSGQYFWDSKLGTYCIPMTAAYFKVFGIPEPNGATCIPFPFATSLFSWYPADHVYEGPACAGGELLASMFASVSTSTMQAPGSQPWTTVMGFTSDGGIWYVAPVGGGPLSTRLDDGGCGALPRDGGIDALYRVTGPASTGDLARGNYVTE